MATGREQRTAELMALWSDDPSKVIGIYRRLAEINVLEPLPEGITLAQIVEFIVDRELEEEGA